MSWNGQLQDFILGVLLEADMASLLPDNHPSVPLQCAYDLLVSEARNLCHSTSSIRSASGEGVVSSSTGSR